MSSTAAAVVTLTEELRDLAERLSARAEKLLEENHVLNGRLAAAKAKNSELLEENCKLTESLAQALSLPPRDGNASSGTVATRGGGSESSGGGGHQSVADRSNSSLDMPAGSSAEPAGQQEPATVAAPISAALVQKTLPIGLLFPEVFRCNQNMLSGVKHIPAVRDMLEKTGASLGIDMLELCLLGTPADSGKRFERIICSYIAGLAGLEKLRNECEVAVTRAQAVAGFGISEYAALTAAGVFSFEDGLRLVELRWDALMEVEAASRQLMVFVAGLDKLKLAELCATAARRGGSGAVCQIAVEHFRLGFGVGGTQEAVLALESLAEQAGSMRAMALGRSTSADHTPLMKPVQEKMRAGLYELLPRMSPPRTTVYLNATAAPVRPGTNPEEIVEILVKGLVSPVLWGPSIEAMLEDGISEFYEVGGTTLTDIMRCINAKAWRSMTSIEV